MLMEAKRPLCLQRVVATGGSKRHALANPKG